MSNDFLVFDHVTKRFGALTAVDDVSLKIKRGEFFSLLGPSGCGKTTLLRMLGGFERPDSGRIYLEGSDITDLPPNQRRVHTVFQNYALFPTMTVWDNIAFSLKLAKKPKDEIEDRVNDILEMIQLADQAWKYPNQLSGGQKQRVAIARALVDRPQVLLLDEPLAALDLKLRQHMLIELDAIHDQVGITFIYVTHDQGEAMSLSDRIAVVNMGKIEQLDVPAKIYEAPSSRFVASFIGDTNFFSGEIVSVDGDYCLIQVDGFPQIKAYNDKQLKVGQRVDLSVRPEKIRVTLSPPQPEKGASINVFPSKVGDIVYQGVYTKFWVTSGQLRIQSVKPHSRFLLDQEPITWNDDVFVWWHPDDGYMVEASP
ncbi:MAG: ABC transporter ATP-binding protein [Kiritimatiellae bacterium]|jgi:spermidine/putrescine transport system ATP-binding protein|nr:ABC transporter ATP-binding protein [Kiritimatiellia bacterium]